MQFQGKKLSVTVFGQSHAPAVGMVLCGLPAGTPVDEARLRAFMDRRAPGRSSLTSARQEADLPEFVSGLVRGVTCGAPVCALIRNTDARPADYAPYADTPRPSHADYPARVQSGEAADLRGGGAFSGRMTAPLCVAGGIALQLLAQRNITVGAHLAAVGAAEDARFDPVSVGKADLERVAASGFPAVSPEAAVRMKAEIESARSRGDSVGGLIECAAVGLPAGLGGPLFDGLESSLSAALFAIPAVRGVAFGAGFDAARMRGSTYNDAYALCEGRVITKTNRSGGLLGGMTTGMPLTLTVAFKPTPSISLPQQTVNLRTMRPETIALSGRHDPCVALRAVPVVEAVTALVLLDRLL